MSFSPVAGTCPGGPDSTVEMSEASSLPAQHLAQGRDLVWNELNKELTDVPAAPIACQAVSKCELVGL